MSTPKSSNKRRARPSSVHTPTDANDKSSAAEQEPEPVFEGDVLVIAQDGDIVLRIEHSLASADHSHAFRVRSKVLRTGSRFFERLIGPSGFGERAQIEKKHRQLEQLHPGIPISAVAASELPAVTVKDLGRTGNIKNVQALLADFLTVLHGAPLQREPPVPNLVNLAIVADRFDHLEALQGWQNRKKLLAAVEARTSVKQDAALVEEKTRQRLLAGLMYEFLPWIEKYSARIVIQGWTVERDEAAQWWDLPMRVEEELAYRRELVLETIESMQQFHIKPFLTRGERQCRLGYENSQMCDSFQLGEMIRFFDRVQTLRLQGTIQDSVDEHEGWTSSIYDLLDTLKQIPEYQIDKFHTHCGMRTRFAPLVELIETALPKIGICAECWRESGKESLWIHRKRPVQWRRSTAVFRKMGHGAGRGAVAEMFLADERNWSNH